jgi:hypothetical protein
MSLYVSSFPVSSPHEQSLLASVEGQAPVFSWCLTIPGETSIKRTYVHFGRCGVFCT